jgi:hypothetical protein
MNGDRCYGVTDAEKINENNRLKEEKQSHRTWSGLPDFSWYSTPKRGKYTKMTTKCKKLPQNIRNGSKIDQISIKFTHTFRCKTLQNLPKLVFLV